MPTRDENWSLEGLNGEKLVVDRWSSLLILVEDDQHLYALEALLIEGRPDQVGRVLRGIRKRMRRPHWQRVVQVLRHTHDDERKAEIIARVYDLAPRPQRRELARISRGIRKADTRARASAAVALTLLEDEALQALADARAIRDIRGRALTLAALAARLPAVEQQKVCREALALAAKHPQHAWLLGDVAKRALANGVPYGLLILSIRELSSSSKRLSALGGLAERASRVKLAREVLATLDAAGDDEHVATWLDSLARWSLRGGLADEVAARLAKLPPKRLISHLQNAYRRIGKREVRALVEKARELTGPEAVSLLAPVGRMLPADELARLLPLCADAEPKAVFALLSSTSKQIPPKLISLAISVLPSRPSDQRLEILLQLAPSAPSEQRPKLVSECVRLALRPRYQPSFSGWRERKLVATVAPYLRADAKPKAWTPVVAAAIASGYEAHWDKGESKSLRKFIADWPASALLDLWMALDGRYTNHLYTDGRLSLFPADRCEDFLNLVLAAPRLEGRLWLLSSLARRLSGPSSRRAMDTALALVPNETDAFHRVEWLLRIAPEVTPEIEERVVSLTKTAHGYYRDGEMWDALVPALSEVGLGQAQRIAEHLPDAELRFHALALIAGRSGSDRRGEIARKLRALFDRTGRDEIGYERLLDLAKLVDEPERTNTAREVLQAMLEGAYQPRAEQFVAMTDMLISNIELTQMVAAVDRLGVLDRVNALEHLNRVEGGLEGQIRLAKREARRIGESLRALRPVRAGPDSSTVLMTLGRDISRRLVQQLLGTPREVLLCSSAPRAVRPGDQFVARFAACTEELKNSVADRLMAAQRDAHVIAGLARSRWCVGARVAVRLSVRNMPTLEQSFTWNGNEAILDFVVELPATETPRRLVLTFEVAVAEVVIATLAHETEVAEASNEQRSMQEAWCPRSAFASYTQKDRDRVLDRVTSLRNVANMDVFMDCLDIRPGVEFQPLIEREIRDRQLFLLYWSQYARESQWVRWEWGKALEFNTKIAPQPLEDPGVTPPPDALKHLNFNDYSNRLRT